MFKPTKTEDLGDTKPANAPSSTTSSGAPSGSGQDAQRRPAASSGSRSVLGSDLKIVGKVKKARHEAIKACVDEESRGFRLREQRDPVTLDVVLRPGS